MGRVAVFIILASVFLSPVVQAQDQEEFRDFTFRRVAIPQQGSSTPRISVQIDPVEQALILAPPSKPEVKPDRPVEDVLASPTADWFWQIVSPALSAANPGRLQDALHHIENAPEAQNLVSPRLQHLQQIAIEHGRDILLATVGTDVSPALVLAVISVESSGRTAAKSSAGAVGLMQLMPATAERFGVSDRTDPVQNIKGGVVFLDLLIEMFNGDPMLVLAGYNAGENAVLNKQGVPPYAETRQYVPKVLAAWRVASALCLTPPMFISDGCVFAGLEVAATE